MEKQPIAIFNYKNGKACKVYKTIELNEFLDNSNEEWFCENPFAMNATIIYNEQ